MAHPAPTLINYAEALECITRSAVKLSAITEIIELKEGLGRTLSVEIRAPENFPPHACSAMDGFAFNLANVECGKLYISTATIMAGDEPIEENAEKNIWEIMTGAPLPSGADTIVRIEDCRVKRSRDQVQVEFIKLPDVGRNIRKRAEDFSKDGPAILKTGHTLCLEDLLCLATLGILTVAVHAKLRVGLIATGKELVPISDTPSAGEIRNSSALFLQLALESYGCTFFHLGIIKDEPLEFEKLLKSNVIDNLDLIISTGAISMGQLDFIGQSLENVGARFLFRKVKVRPAKPILFAEILKNKKSILFLGLPGQPVATDVGLRFFVKPLIEASQGKPSQDPLRLPLSHSISKAEGLTNFLRAKIVTIKDRSFVQVHSQQQTSMLSPLLECNAWVMLEEASRKLPAGEFVSVYPF